MEHLFTSESIISFLILVVLEVVLGIDNVIFVSIIVNRLKEKEQKRTEKEQNGKITLPLVKEKKEKTL